MRRPFPFVALWTRCLNCDKRSARRTGSAKYGEWQKIHRLRMARVSRMAEADSVESLVRGLRVLRHLQSDGALSFMELQRLTALSKGALTRSLNTLRHEGWIAKRLIDNRYQVCASTQPQTRSDSIQEQLAALAAPVIARMQERMIWPSDISVCDGDCMVILDSSRALSPLRLNRKVVSARPTMLWSAMGRAYLAHCPTSERRRILVRLRKSARPDDAIAGDRARVARLLRETRRQGYGVREDGYLSPDNKFPGQLSAIAVPVFVGTEVLGALSCVWLTAVATRAQIVERHLAGLQAAARQIGARFDDHGFRRPQWTQADGSSR